MKRTAVTLAVLAVALIGAAPATAPTLAHAVTCTAGQVTVNGQDRLPCDLVPGRSTLTVTGISRLECADLGGAWAVVECERVDW